MRHIASIVLLAFVLWSCSEDRPPRRSVAPQPAKKTEPFVALDSIPAFNADSAFQFIQDQVDFGPRVPNSEAHAKTARYLESKLRKYGAEVTVQNGTVEAFDGTQLQLKNVIGRYQPEKKDRVMLFAHWDTRPFADRGEVRRTKPIEGANDGGSGVGVILELLRSISQYGKQPNVGIDIIFFDAEDYGRPQTSMTGDYGNTWCLGSRHWGENPPIEDFNPKYGILLDMVGASNAVFPKENGSLRHASSVVAKVWSVAQGLGYGKYFINESTGGELTDDHKMVNELTAIPSIDIIHYEPWRRDFGTFHHTHEDNMSLIDKVTLGVVGHTMLEVIYRE